MRVKGTTKDKKSCEVNLNIGDDLEQMVSRFGRDIVYYCAKTYMTNNAERMIRYKLGKGQHPEQVREYMERKWFPVKHLQRTVYRELIEKGDL